MSSKTSVLPRTFTMLQGIDACGIMGEDKAFGIRITEPIGVDDRESKQDLI